MDYHRPLNASKTNPKVHVALILIPGVHEKPDSYSTSPLLVNPGGPGGSGVQIALAMGKSLQTVLGEDQDVIGFDPRGIGATTPRADCFSFPDDHSGEDDYVQGQFHRMLSQTSGREIGLTNSSEVALHKIDVRARSLGKLCGEKDSVNGNDSVLKYVSTPNVARDMISIIDAWDEWVAAGGGAVPEKETVEARQSEQPHNLDTKGKLVYWGFSYGVSYIKSLVSSHNLRTYRLFLEPRSRQCSRIVSAVSYLMVWWTQITTCLQFGRNPYAMLTLFPNHSTNTAMKQARNVTSTEQTTRRPTSRTDSKEFWPESGKTLSYW
jgi:hypothetical protein